MTREEILSIEEYCAEHKVSHRKRLEELNIPFWHFYKAKKKYRKDDEQDASFGEFIQLSSGRFVPHRKGNIHLFIWGKKMGEYCRNSDVPDSVSNKE